MAKEDRSQKIIERFIDGEKNLFSKIAEISENLLDSDTSPHANYLRAYFADDNANVSKYKKEIKGSLKPVRIKPNFKKDKD